jgi:predicted DNA-binding transcriptional regulator YafY
MVRKRKPAGRSSAAVTVRRAPRLYRLLKLLGRGAQTRARLLKQLSLDIRSFYRDLNLLRDAGIEVRLVDGHYVLQGSAAEAVARLPFPDPLLTLGEAQQLAKGRTAAHQKLKQLLARIIK